MGRTLRTRLSAINAATRYRVKTAQEKQKNNFSGNRTLELAPNDLVVARDYGTNQWRDAQVIGKTGAVMYDVRTDDNRIWKRHIDQLKLRELNVRARNTVSPSTQSPESEQNDKCKRNEPSSVWNNAGSIDTASMTAAPAKPAEFTASTTQESAAISEGQTTGSAAVPLRRSTRRRKASTRLDL